MCAAHMLATSAPSDDHCPAPSAAKIVGLVFPFAVSFVHSTENWTSRHAIREGETEKRCGLHTIDMSDW